MAKFKRKQQSNDFLNRVSKIATWTAAILVVIAAAAGGGYYLGYSDATETAQKERSVERAEMKRAIQKLERESLKSKSVSDLNQRLKSVLERDKEYQSAEHEYADESPRPPEGPKRPLRRLGDKPRLAIIIDDVSFAHDVQALKALKMPLTMSFLPPSKRHPDSAALAAGEPYYMVHLPLEAQRFNSEEPFTLRVEDSQEMIAERVAKIKRLFPKVRFVNNHTGSKFTADEMAVNRLVYALRREKIGFIDSRTTAETKVPKVMQSYGLPYVARDVFLDHENSVEYVKRQIRKAVEKAKQHGSAIAIGHPRKETIEALRQSRVLLDDVELVRIDQLI